MNDKVLIDALANKLFEEEFANCYMCDNYMKNITIDGVNNGCDGNCQHNKKYTTDDFLERFKEELERSNND